MMQAYRNLNVWQKSMDLVDMIYSASVAFPKDETYGLRSQMRRSAVSVPSNIAEGSQRNSKKEFQRYLSVAYASLAELETQIEIASRQHYVKQDVATKIFTLTGEIGKMLNGLAASIDEKLPTANSKRQTLEEV